MQGESGPTQSAAPLEPFLDQTRVLDAIDTIATATRLNVLAGAGVSRQALLPTWSQLIKKLLRQAAHQAVSSAESDQSSPPTEQGEMDDFAALVLKREHAIAAASLAAVVLRPTNSDDDQAKFAEVMRGILYEKKKNKDEDGEEEFVMPAIPTLAAKIARAQAVWGANNLRIATTNYDPLITDAVGKLLGRERQRSEDGRRKYPEIALDAKARQVNSAVESKGESEILVHHLHGFVGNRDEPYSNLIVTEADYFLDAAEIGWQEAMLHEWFGQGTTLILGASLTDPDIIRILFNAQAKLENGATRPPIFALLHRHRSYNEPDKQHTLEPGEQLHERLSLERWATAGVTVLYYDHYYEMGAFVSEVLARRAQMQGLTARASTDVASGAPEATRRSKRPAKSKKNPGPKRMVRLPEDGWSDSLRYPDRLHRWYGEFCRVRLGFALDETWEDKQAAFQRSQPKTSKVMRKLSDSLEDWLALNSAAPDTSELNEPEQLSLHIWSRYLPGDSLAMTIASDRSWGDLSAVSRRIINQRSRFLAIRAFSEGRLVMRTDGDDIGHLGYQVAIPIELDSAPCRGIPVGSITLSSTRPRHRSKLLDLDDKAFLEMRGFLQMVGQRMLDPQVRLNDSNTDISPSQAGVG